MTSSPQAKRFDWSNLGLRVASAAVLVPAVLAAVGFGGWPYLVLIAIGVALLAIEWGGMTAPGAPTRVAAAVAAAVLAAVFVGYRGDFPWAWGTVAIGAAGAAVIARGVAERPADAAFGVLYIAPAALCLVWLRSTNQGDWWTVMLFAATWGADIGAYAVGSTLKGPKLWPWSIGPPVGRPTQSLSGASQFLNPVPKSIRTGSNLSSSRFQVPSQSLQHR